MHRAKQYLKKYRKLQKRAQDIELQLREQREEAKVEELEELLIQTHLQCVGERVDILEKSERMPGRNDSAVLWYHYIDGLSFGEIADKMNCSFRRVTQAHGEALEKYPV